MKRSGVLLLAVASVAGCSFGDKARTVSYPEAHIAKWDGSRFKTIAWRSWVHRGPCTLVVRLPGGDLGPADWADPDRLRRAGWSEEAEGGRVRLYRPSPPALVECVYEAGRLSEVSVVTFEGDRVEVCVGTRWLALPATPEEITQALGTPPNSD